MPKTFLSSLSSFVRFIDAGGCTITGVIWSGTAMDLGAYSTASTFITVGLNSPSAAFLASFLGDFFPTPRK